MKTLARIGVLVEVCAVEIRQAMLVGGKMRRNPVQNHTHTVLMQDIDRVHQVLRRAIPAGGGEEAGDLIAPRSIEGMFHDRQQLDVSEVQFAYIFRQRSGQLAVGHRPVVLFENAAP